MFSRQAATRILAANALVAFALWGLSGCQWNNARIAARDEAELDHYKSVATKIEYPDVQTPIDYQVSAIPSPLCIPKNATPEYWDLKLEEAVQITLQNSKVLNELGGVVLRSPTTVRTIHNPAIVETDPRFGVEGTLSAFDAVFSARSLFENNDRALNNIFFGGGTRILKQDLNVYQFQLQKQTATGTTFAVRNNTDYDANNSPGNLFHSAWNTNYEVEARQRLLQGGGIDFNRIAGPNGSPGFINGVLIARVNTDISLADFELGLRDLVSNVENTYWDLYYAYRDLDTKLSARNSALETWRRVQALNVTGRRGGEAEKEAEAREQYFRFEEDVQNAYTGRLLDGTRTNNGSSGGTPRGIGGVRVVERRLRLLMGVPITDMRLIRPADEPKLAKVMFDWEEILPEALARRAEIRRQKWIIKKRELELVASRNFLLPTFDVYGIQRWRGFGHDLLNPERQPSQFNNAYQNLTTGNFQEWELGAEFSLPIGYRQGYAAVRNSQLQLSRDRSVLEQQEREVSHDISNAVGDMDRAYEIAQTGFNRRVAARQQLEAVQAAYDAERVQLDLLLEAQRRLAEADARFFFALSEYAIAVKNVHFEKGSLLDFNEIYLSEGPWPGKAYSDASRRDAHTRDAGRLNYIFKKQQPPVSAGPVGRPMPNFGPVILNGPQPEPIQPVPVDALPQGTPQPEPLPLPGTSALTPAPPASFMPTSSAPLSSAVYPAPPISAAPITAAPPVAAPGIPLTNPGPQRPLGPPPSAAPVAPPATPRPQPVVPQPAQMTAAGITPIYYGPQQAPQQPPHNTAVPLPPLGMPNLAPSGPPQPQQIMPATIQPPPRQANAQY